MPHDLLSFLISFTNQNCMDAMVAMGRLNYLSVAHGDIVVGAKRQCLQWSASVLSKLHRPAKQVVYLAQFSMTRDRPPASQTGRAITDPVYTHARIYEAFLTFIIMWWDKTKYSVVCNCIRSGQTLVWGYAVGSYNEGEVGSYTEVKLDHTPKWSWIIHRSEVGS